MQATALPRCSALPEEKGQAKSWTVARSRDGRRGEKDKSFPPPWETGSALDNSITESYQLA